MPARKLGSRNARPRPPVIGTVTVGSGYLCTYVRSIYCWYGGHLCIIPFSAHSVPPFILFPYQELLNISTRIDQSMPALPSAMGC